MKQQELADAIGINMQSLSKIERDVNYPTFDTPEKIMDVLGATPNELLPGEWLEYEPEQLRKYINDYISVEDTVNKSPIKSASTTSKKRQALDRAFSFLC